MRPLLAILVAAMVVVTSGCYSRRSTAVSESKATTILERDGWSPRKTSSGVDSGFAWQRPNDVMSALCFGLIFTRHRVENGEVVSETYGWSLIPGLFGILPGFLVNVPIPLEDETQRSLTSSKG